MNWSVGANDLENQRQTNKPYYVHLNQNCSRYFLKRRRKFHLLHTSYVMPMCHHISRRTVSYNALLFSLYISFSSLRYLRLKLFFFFQTAIRTPNSFFIDFRHIDIDNTQYTTQITLCNGIYM